jgi:hypothetical protein
MSFPNPDNSSGNCCNTTGAPCDCNALIIGEAGPQGSQGFDGIDGSDGVNGISAFTYLAASFTQPNEYPTTGNTVSITVENSSWIALGQTIYVEQAGYYKVTGVPTTTSVSVYLVRAELVSPGQTVTGARKITPSATAYYTDPNITTLEINRNFQSVNPTLKVYGSNQLPLIHTNSILNKIGINVSPTSGSKTVTIGGGLEVTGDTLITNGYVRTPRLRVASSTPTTDLVYIGRTQQNVSGVTVGNTLGALAKVNINVSGVLLGDTLTVSYGTSPLNTFSSDVSIRCIATGTNTATLFFQNHTTNGPYTGLTLDLIFIITRYAVAS